MMKTLNSLATKYKNAIKEISDERSNGDGFWIYLKHPFFNPESESNIIHEQKLSDCILILKSCVNNHSEKPVTAKFKKGDFVQRIGKSHIGITGEIISFVKDMKEKKAVVRWERAIGARTSAIHTTVKIKNIKKSQQ